MTNKRAVYWWRWLTWEKDVKVLSNWGKRLLLKIRVGWNVSIVFLKKVISRLQASAGTITAFEWVNISCFFFLFLQDILFRYIIKMTGKRAAVIGTGYAYDSFSFIDMGIDPSSYSFSGLCSAIRLKQELDIQVDLFEINNDVAGTWQNNRYWGAACDIPSHLYSLSFELNPSMWFFPTFF